MEEGEVQLPLVQQDREVLVGALGGLHLNVGVPPLKGGEHPGQHQGGPPEVQAHPHGAAGLPLQLGQVLAEAALPLLVLPHIAQIALPRLGEPEGGGLTVEQLDPQVLLQPLQAAAHGGLGQVEPLGRFGDAPRLGDGQKGFVLFGDHVDSSYYMDFIAFIS